MLTSDSSVDSFCMEPDARSRRRGAPSAQRPKAAIRGTVGDVVSAGVTRVAVPVGAMQIVPTIVPVAIDLSVVAIRIAMPTVEVTVMAMIRVRRPPGAEHDAGDRDQ